MTGPWRDRWNPASPKANPHWARMYAAKRRALDRALLAEAESLIPDDEASQRPSMARETPIGNVCGVCGRNPNDHVHQNGPEIEDDIRAAIAKAFWEADQMTLEPTQGEEETARAIEICHELGGAFGHSDVLMIAAALRQRADEAFEEAAKLVKAHGDRCISPQSLDDWYEARLDEIAAAIHARITPKGQT